MGVPPAGLVSSSVAGPGVEKFAGRRPERGPRRVELPEGLACSLPVRGAASHDGSPGSACRCSAVNTPHASQASAARCR
ncbi:hypothetical protein NGM37_28490, partial [Streptomyces sp. TRM76130]|nr:hypothetical protein [Streptomyces sp. TRM76130]